MLLLAVVSCPGRTSRQRFSSGSSCWQVWASLGTSGAGWAQAVLAACQGAQRKQWATLPQSQGCAVPAQHVLREGGGHRVPQDAAQVHAAPALLPGPHQHGHRALLHHVQPCPGAPPAPWLLCSRLWGLRETCASAGLDMVLQNQLCASVTCLMRRACCFSDVEQQLPGITVLREHHVSWLSTHHLCVER